MDIIKLKSIYYVPYTDAVRSTHDDVTHDRRCARLGQEFRMRRTRRISYTISIIIYNSFAL